MEKQRAKEQNRTGSQNQQEKAPLVPYRFLTHGSQGLEIDLRLCNRDIIGSAKPHLLHILNTAMQVIFIGTGIPRFTLLMWGHIKKTRKAKTT